MFKIILPILIISLSIIILYSNKPSIKSDRTAATSLRHNRSTLDKTPPDQINVFDKEIDINSFNQNQQVSKQNTVKTPKSPPPNIGVTKADFPYLTWEQKLKRYYAGRPVSEIRYPAGLNFQGVQQLSDNVYSIDQQEFKQQEAKEDLMTHAKIDDSFGRPTFSEVVPGGVFDRLGIISGDQITSLDGTTIHNYADLYNAYQQTNGKDEVTLHILRNGQPIEFTYFIQ